MVIAFYLNNILIVITMYLFCQLLLEELSNYRYILWENTKLFHTKSWYDSYHIIPNIILLGIYFIIFSKWQIGLRSKTSYWHLSLIYCSLSHFFFISFSFSLVYVTRHFIFQWTPFVFFHGFLLKCIFD